jgi:ADP-ribose pyrophosphatase
VKPWIRTEPTEIHKSGWRTFVRKTFILPDGRSDKFDIINKDNWQGVATIALTKSGKILVLRQYRAGPEVIMDELPGGLVDDEDKNLEAAARRELLEETGYEATNMIYLGKQSFDAWTNGWRHYFLAEGCYETSLGLSLDENEFGELRLIDVDKLIDNALNSRMTDSGGVLLACAHKEWPVGTKKTSMKPI